MNEVEEFSDSDVFEIKQIKPVNKLTFNGAHIIKQSALNSFRCKKNIIKKKQDKVRKLSIESDEPKHKKKKHNCELASDGNFHQKLSESNNMNYKSNSHDFCVSSEVFEVCVKKTPQQNKLEITKRDLTGNELKGYSEEVTREELLESNTIESLHKHSLKETNIKTENIGETHKDESCRKNSECSQGVYQKKEFENYSNFVYSNADKSTPEFFEKLKDNCPADTQSNRDISPSFFRIVDPNVKSEAKFEKFYLTFPFEDNCGETLNINKQVKEAYSGNSELLCFLLKKIIIDEMKKQSELEQKSYINGKVCQTLFSKSEHEILVKFFHLEDSACKLFVRMLTRKNDWHRVSTIKYEDIDEDLQKDFVILREVNFVDFNIENEDFKTQMNLLNKPEVLKLCRAFNVCLKIQKSANKDFIIKSLIEECKKQRSVLDIFKGKNRTSRVDLLKSEIKKYLGMCVKLNKITFATFHKILLLFSFTHYFDKEEKRFSNELWLCLKVYKNLIKFPKYKLSFSIVFETRPDFEEYQTSVILFSAFEMAISSKNHNEFIAIINKVKIIFKGILKNYEYQKRFLSLPSFLQKFSAGTVYAKILTKYCKVFKKNANNLIIIETAELLLSQNFFLQRKRGDWYEILSKALENQKQSNSAAEIIVTSLKDPFVNEVQRLALQLRGQGILRKKSNGITDILLRQELDHMCIMSVQEPASIEIKGKSLDGNQFGYKCVYVQETRCGKMYISVEEMAISYYKKHGFTKGYHVEGSIVYSIFFLLFFDIIYELSPEGVFQSPYQDAPLDLYSAAFYLNRKREIDILLTDMVSWDDIKIETTIKKVYLKNYNSNCVISWNEEFTPELFCEVIKCMTMPILILIFQRLLQNFRVYRSGFPDLTLWNPETNTIKFVEVKSPNDRLSPAQKIWLNYLSSIGLCSEVCNVKHLSGKKL